MGGFARRANPPILLVVRYTGLSYKNAMFVGRDRRGERARGGNRSMVVYHRNCSWQPSLSDAGGPLPGEFVSLPPPLARRNVRVARQWHWRNAQGESRNECWAGTASPFAPFPVHFVHF